MSSAAMKEVRHARHAMMTLVLMRRRDAGKKMEGRARKTVRRVLVKLVMRKARSAVRRCESVDVMPPTPWVSCARSGMEMLVEPITREDWMEGREEVRSRVDG